MRMAEHAQVEVDYVGKWKTMVDRGLEDVLLNLWHWDFDTNNSCIDNFRKIWIEFEYFQDLQRLMQLALVNNTKVNRDKYERTTLFTFLGDENEGEAEFEIHFGEGVIFDPNEEDTVIGTGELDYGMSLRFPKDKLSQFKELLFEVFPFKSS